MMKRTLGLAVVAGFAASFGLGGVAFADHKTGHEVPPGQDRVCLLEFNDPANVEDGADADIVSAKWLPRHAAEKQAEKHPERTTQFPWTEEDCKSFEPS